MTRPCATPGCATLTFGEVCLGCLQLKAKARPEAEGDAEAHAADDSPSDSAAS
jgi:hypothetical protein